MFIQAHMVGRRSTAERVDCRRPSVKGTRPWCCFKCPLLHLLFQDHGHLKKQVEQRHCREKKLTELLKSIGVQKATDCERIEKARADATEEIKKKEAERDKLRWVLFGVGG